jgi:hypothetical protein
MFASGTCETPTMSAVRSASGGQIGKQLLTSRLTGFDPKRTGAMSYLLSESSPKTFSLIVMDCRNWGCDNRRFPASDSDNVWPSSASELRIRAVRRDKKLYLALRQRPLSGCHSLDIQMVAQE